MSEQEEVSNSSSAASPRKWDLDLDAVEKMTAPARAQTDFARSVVATADVSKSMTRALQRAADMRPHIEQAMKGLANFRAADLLPPMPEPYTPKLEAISIPPNPAYETNRLLNELLTKIEEQGQQNAKLIAPNYDPNSGLRKVNTTKSIATFVRSKPVFRAN